MFLTTSTIFLTLLFSSDSLICEPVNEYNSTTEIEIMALPDYTNQDPATYKANIDSSMAAASTLELVFLDTPESITVSASPLGNTWITISNTTLATAGAKTAIVSAFVNGGSTGTTISAEIFARKTGSVLATNSGTRIGHNSNGYTTSQSRSITASGRGTVNLDTSQDFDIYFKATNVSSVFLYLLGYYIEP